jgi:hypothetical protein
MAVHHRVPVATEELYQPVRHCANRHAAIARAEPLSNYFEAASA